ncbi:MAG: hypothetical protein MUE51_05810 [Thermoleophilia bacterium]|nr:hypothetical protein [Thermoleophilia bacterium]
MGLLDRWSATPPTPSVAGRAYVVPTSTGNVGSDDEGNVDNTSHRASVRSTTLLELRWVADGGPMPAEAQRVTQPLANWLRIVMHDAGTNTDLAARLPAELVVPVWVDAATRRIERIDTDTAEAELERFRETARREWKETEAPLAPVRQAMALPGLVLRGVRALPKGIRDTISELRSDLAGGAPRDPTPAETEQLRRTSTILGYQLERDPKQHARVRASALQAGPMIAEATRAGSYGYGNFENWLMMQTLSRVITEEEAAAFRAAAGTPPPDGDPS